jgi:hypothetical protein
VKFVVDKVASPNNSGFPCQYHSTNAPYSFSSTCCSYQKDKWAKPGNLPEISDLSKVREHWIEKYTYCSPQILPWTPKWAGHQGGLTDIQLKRDADCNLVFEVMLPHVSPGEPEEKAWGSSTPPPRIKATITLISGFRRDVDEICGLLGYYAASCGNCLPTFRDNVSVPSPRVKSPSRKESQPIR